MTFEPFRKLLLERQALLERIDAESLTPQQDVPTEQTPAVFSTARRRHEIRAIRAALVRIDNRRYGCCEECGCTIPETRLSRYPTVTVCADCAETREEEVHKG